MSDYNGLDIDRLHDTIVGDGDGQSYATCYTIVGAIQIAEKGGRICVHIPIYEWVQHLVPMILDVLAGNHMSFSTTARNQIRVRERGNVFIIELRVFSDRSARSCGDIEIDGFMEEYCKERHDSVTATWLKHKEMYR